MTKILGIIPARGGSKRLPGKNTRLLGGKPLITRTIDSALASKKLDRIAVSSDSEEVLAFAKDHGNENLFFLRRPDEISRDDSPAIEYVNHALEFFKGKGEEFDVVVILQPSSPFTSPEDIDGTINLLLDSGADSAVSVVKLAHDINPLKMKIMDGDKLLPYLEEEKGRMEHGKLPEIYVRNCSVYASKKGVIDTGRIIGDDCRGFVMPRERSVDINDEFDFLLSEFLNSGRV